MAALYSILPGLRISQALLSSTQVSTATRSLQQELAHRDSTIRALEAQVARLQVSESLPGQELGPVTGATATCSQAVAAVLIAARCTRHTWCDSLFLHAVTLSCGQRLDHVLDGSVAMWLT